MYDYYKILNVSRTASESEIKRAYRKLCRQYHPDISQRPGTTEFFSALHEAYKTLLDPESRRAHDDLLSGRNENPREIRQQRRAKRRHENPVIVKSQEILPPGWIRMSLYATGLLSGGIVAAIAFWMVITGKWPVIMAVYFIMAGMLFWDGMNGLFFKRRLIFFTLVKRVRDLFRADF